jgi:Domain of unknown function (DUF4920)
MRSRRTPFPAALVVVLAACNLVPPSPAEPAESPRPQAAAFAPSRPVAVEPPAAPAPTQARPVKRSFGKTIRSNDVVTLAAVAADPKTFNHRSIVTEGVVTKVCQEAGCWMAIKDGANDALVRMENHAFFLPKDAAGQHARIEGRILLVKDGKECDEAEAEHAQLSMEAVGVELAAK